MTEETLRIRSFLEQWHTVLVVALVVLALVGGWLTYTGYITPGTHQERRSIHHGELTGSFSTRATVTAAADGTVFTPGTVVHDRSVYLDSVMPVLDGRLHLAYTAADRRLHVRVERQVVTRSVEAHSGATGNTTVYWQEARSLGTTTETMSPGEATTVPFSLNVSKTMQRAHAVQQRLGSPGTLQTRVRMVVIATPGGDTSKTQTTNFTLGIASTGSVYRVQANPHTETFSRESVVTVPNRSGAIRTTLGPVLFVLGALCAGALVVLRSREHLHLSETERRWLAYRGDRDEFSEWITTIRLPDAADDLPVAEAESLRDLVDFAIDTDNAVLESPDTGSFTVVHDGYRYVYRPPTLTTGTPNETSPPEDASSDPDE